MALETGTYISDLVPANPPGSDPKSQGDDHLRLIKSTIKTTFPNVNGEVNRTPAQLNKAGVDATESVTGIAEIATQSETDTGTDDTRIVTPKKLLGGGSYLLSGAGYIALPSWLGSVVIQWGSATSSASADVTVTLPYALSSALYAVAGNSLSASSGAMISFNTYTTTGFKVGAYTSGGGRGVVGVGWIALGV
jgi:hypothetical protein